MAAVISLSSLAQEKLVLAGKAPDNYIIHPVKDGENLTSISTRFGITAAKLAAYNSLNPAAPLVKNFQIRIPISKENLLQDNSNNNQPVYHIIGKGDNLYRLSLAYNKVNIATLKDWNNMKNDIVKDGQHVIVGFIVDHAVADTKKESKPKAISPIAEATPQKAQPPIEKPAEKKKTDLVANQPTQDVPNKINESKAEPNLNNNPGYQPKEGDEGYFAVGYSQHTANQLKQFRSGDAATFKTISGWTDHKYYVLVNDVSPGTILRITGVNNKNICAKVLGPLPDAKTGAGLLLRMSNAAAAALGATDPKFTITVTYFE
jgi:LysM repeat protein